MTYILGQEPYAVLTNFHNWHLHSEGGEDRSGKKITFQKIMVTEYTLYYPDGAVGHRSSAVTKPIKRLNHDLR